MQKTLIVLGLILIIAGLGWSYFSKIPLFKLPGDIIIDKPGFKVFIPITSMILISVVVSIIVWLVRKFF